MKYSIIIPVYNRPQEVRELMSSLVRQSSKDFEVVIVEDGSSDDCKDEVDAVSDRLAVSYFYKDNSGPGDSRNFGMEKASGDYLLFFDSDCLLPSDYLSKLDKYLEGSPADLFGGPDREHESFTNTQKAINYAMTSFITTGGIRGRKNEAKKYQPRTFNMGFSRAVYDEVGGFCDLHPGEDPDLSIRIRQAGYSVKLFPDLFVYHNRRIDFQKFYKQVYKFGVVRNILFKWYPTTKRFVFFLPTFFLLGSVLLVLSSIVVSTWFFLPLILMAAVLFLDAWMATGKIGIAIQAVYASFIQLYGYGWGFLKSYVQLFILGRDERVAFPEMFF